MSIEGMPIPPPASSSLLTVAAPTLSLAKPAPNSSRRSRPDVFRPISKLPLDPFSELDAPEPFSIDSDHLTSLMTFHEHRRAIVLITGDPTTPDIGPFLLSSAVASSLVIIATTSPPPLPEQLSITGPHIRILRLASSDASAALKLASLLERASEVAHTWRTSKTNDRILQFSEADGVSCAEFCVPEEPTFVANWHNSKGDDRQSLASGISRLSSPAPSVISDRSPSHSSKSPLATPPPTRPTSTSQSRPASIYSFISTSSISSLRSTASVNSLKSTQSKVVKKKKVKVVRGDSRIFDAVINVLPQPCRGVEKSVLKNVVLLTTLGGGFLSGAPHDLPSERAIKHVPHVSGDSSKSRYSTMRKAKSTDALAQMLSPHMKDSESYHNSPSPPGSVDARKRRRRLTSAFSLFSHSSSSSEPSSPVVAAKPPPQTISHPILPLNFPNRAHIIHVVPSSYFSFAAPLPGPINRSTTPKPPSKPYLIQSIEQFLLSYSYPLPSSSLGQTAKNPYHYPGVGSAVLESNPILDYSSSKPLAYILPSRAFVTAPPSCKEPTVGEIIYLGGLDSRRKGTGRSWIAEPSDIRMSGDGSDSPKNPSLLAETSAANSPVHSRVSSENSKHSQQRSSVYGEDQSPNTSGDNHLTEERGKYPVYGQRLSDTDESDEPDTPEHDSHPQSAVQSKPQNSMLPTPPNSSGGSQSEDEVDLRSPSTNHSQSTSSADCHPPLSSASDDATFVPSMNSEKPSLPPLKDGAQTLPRLTASAKIPGKKSMPSFRSLKMRFFR